MLFHLEGQMRVSEAPDHRLRPAPMSHATPIVFVVDDDVSVRESLEMMIRWTGWQPETFASARDFLSHPRVVAPSCLVLDVNLRT
jgi:FixJ family two-component response regulator